MQAVAFIKVTEVINKKLNWQEIIDESQADTWLLKSDNFFSSKEDQEEALKIAFFIKPSKKIFEIHTCNTSLISKLLPDCVLLSSDFTLFENLEALKICRKYEIPVSYRISDSSDSTENKTTINNILQICSCFPEVTLLLRLKQTSPSWWIENLLKKVPNEVYLHSCPACIGKKYNLKYIQARIIELIDEKGLYTTPISSQVQEMGKIKKCLTCANNKNCLGFLKENKTLSLDIFPLTKKENYCHVIDSVKEKILPIDLGNFKINPDSFTLEESYLSEKEKKVIRDLTLLQACHTFKTFKGYNYFDFIRFTQPIIVNRLPVEVDRPLFSKENNLWALNLNHIEYGWTNNKKRTLHSHAFNTGTLYILGKVYFDTQWTLEDKNKLNNFLKII